MCNLDETYISTKEDVLKNTVLYNNEKGPRLLPDQFKTVQGETVKLVGKQHSCNLALISYCTSEVQGNVLFNAIVEKPSVLLAEVDSLYDEGFLEDDNGDEVDSLVLPIDAIDLSPVLKGVIVDCDLRGYDNGFTWLLGVSSKATPGLKSLRNVLHTVKSFVKTMSHLCTKGYYWQAIDDHQFFFNAEYGSFRLVFDGGIVKKDKDVASNWGSQLKRSVSDIIMFLLIGAWPKAKENGLLKHPVSDNTNVFWDLDADKLCGNVDVINCWESLPLTIRKALYNSCFTVPNIEITLEEWINILQNAIDDVEKCVYCGNDIFKTAEHCLFCGKTTKKGNLLTKWSIHAKNQTGELRLSFGRKTVIPGEFFGFPSGFMPYMVIMYNSKSNILGIKNTSNITWRITKRENTNILKPGSVTAIDNEMVIEFEGHPGTEMHFLGYEY